MPKPSLFPPLTAEQCLYCGGSESDLTHLVYPFYPGDSPLCAVCHLPEADTDVHVKGEHEFVPESVTPGAEG